MPYGRIKPRRPVQRTGPRANMFDAGCAICGRKVPAYTGILTGNRDVGYTIRHADRRWHGSPVSGKWIGGCEGNADQPQWWQDSSAVPESGPATDKPTAQSWSRPHAYGNYGN